MHMLKFEAAHVLRQMVTDVSERHISPLATEILRAVEDSEREQLRMFGAPEPGYARS